MSTIKSAERGAQALARSVYLCNNQSASRANQVRDLLEDVFNYVGRETFETGLALSGLLGGKEPSTAASHTGGMRYAYLEDDNGNVVLVNPALVESFRPTRQYERTRTIITMNSGREIGAAASAQAVRTKLENAATS